MNEILDGLLVETACINLQHIIASCENAINIRCSRKTKSTANRVFIGLCDDKIIKCRLRSVFEK